MRSRSTRPLYALCVVHGDQVIREEKVTWYRLMKLLWREEPRVLACDSLTEISKKHGDLYSIVSALPSATKLVVVTGAGSNRISLVALAKRYNISFDRFDPFAEARACALVASRGAGFEVVAFGDETIISVSRNRSPGKGGWSQNRYARKIHGHVLVRSRLIEERLHASGLSFSKQELKAFGGLSRVVFVVKARREQIPITNQMLGDVRVLAEGKRLDRVMFTPLTKKPGFVIVGIDPGTTLGIALLDLSGKLLTLRSSRQQGLSDAIALIASIGRPVVVASDVHPMPFSVEKIRRAFHAVAYTPSHDLSVAAKYALTREYAYTNDHERDALSAALSAYQFWNHRFLGIARRVPEGVDLEEVYAGIIRGLSVEQILESLKQNKDILSSLSSKKPDTKNASLDKKAVLNGEDDDIINSHVERIRVLEGMVKDLRLYLQQAQEECTEKDKELASIKQRIDAMRDSRRLELQRDIEVNRRDNIIKGLKRRLRNEERNNKKLYRRLKKLQKTDDGDDDGKYIRCGVISDLSKDLVKQYLESPGWQDGVDNGILYAHAIASWSKGVISDLLEAGISVLVCGAKSGVDPRLSALCFDLSLPLVTSAAFPDLKKKTGPEHGLLSDEVLRLGVREWERDAQRYHSEKKNQEIEALFSEYKAERELEVRKKGK